MRDAFDKLLFPPNYIIDSICPMLHVFIFHGNL